jgi:GntR family transcriptional regulator
MTPPDSSERPTELVRSSAGTLHGQLYQALVGSIETGAARPGDRMPTETELMESYGVSRTTARRALDDLRRNGLVERRPGKGTFVVKPRMDAAIAGLHSVTDEIEMLGYRAGARLLSVQEDTADESAAGHLGIAPGDPVLLISRLRTADDRPFYFAYSVLNVTRLPELREADFTAPSFYRLFEQVTGRAVARAVQWLSAVPAGPEVARQLKVEPGAPVLQLERVSYLENEIAVESVQAFFQGQSYKFYSESVPAHLAAGPQR